MKTRDFVLAAASATWRLLDTVISKGPRNVALTTFPDFDDTARVMVSALPRRGYKLTILKSYKDAVAPAWCMNAGVATHYRYSVMGLWSYYRATLAFSTHGCFSRWPLSGRQCVVNLWHGMPIKRIGFLDGKARSEVSRFHYTIASNDFFRDVMREAFGVRLDQVLIADHPRLDMLRAPRPKQDLALPKHRWLTVWLPTFRVSVAGDKRVDGSASSDLFRDGHDIHALDRLFAARDIVCIVKPHPMAPPNPERFKSCKALLYFDETELRKRDLTLYQLLSLSDFMITDVSSVYFDYASLGRPIIPFCKDLEEYRSSRGFVAPVQSLIKEAFCTTDDELFARLDEILAASEPIGDTAKSTPLQTPATDRLLDLVEQQMQTRA